MAKVLLFGEIEELVGASEVQVHGKRVLDVLVSLSSLYGGDVKEFLLGERPENVHLIILVNNAPVRRDVLEVQLDEDDTLSLMPMREA